MRMSKMSRRQLLMTLGGAVAASALDPFVPRILAQSSGAPPRRFLYFFTGTAAPSDLARAFYPTARTGSLTFATGSPLASLNRHAKNMCFVKGVNLDSADVGNGGPHPKGAIAALSGEGLRGLKPGEEEFMERQTLDGSGDSVDQFLAGKTQTTFRSLDLGIDNQPDFRGNATKSVSYSKRHVVERLQNPRVLFDRLFATLGQGDGKPDSAVLRARAERRSVLDFVAGSVNRLSQRVGTEDRERFDAHLEAVRAVEKQLDALESGGASCDALKAPALGTDAFKQEANYPAVHQAFVDLMALSMSCDLTRIAGLQHSNPTDVWRYPWLNLPLSGFGNYHQATHTQGAAADAFVRGVWGFRAQAFAQWLSAFDAIKEESGTLLDNSFIVWLQDCGQAHDHDTTLCITAGGGGGFFKTGQVVDAGGVPHNRLLTSICEYMGSPVSTFGNARHGQGTLSTLHK